MKPLLIFAVLIAAGGSLFAQTSFPMLGATFPVAVKRGSTGVVTLHSEGNGGSNLFGAYKVLFAGKGITAEIVPPEKPVLPDPKKPNELPLQRDLQLKVTVAPDAEIGVREYRVAASRGGVSTCGQLFISDETEVTEREPNDSLQKAQGLSVPCAVSGRIEGNKDEDFYRFHAEAGQEIVFSVLCARLQDKVHDLQEHCDPLLVLRDKEGNELTRSDDFYRADPALVYRFEKGGDYFLQIRDVNYKGNPNWTYRLSLWNRPWLLSVFPCAVSPGTTLDLSISGWNLGGAKTGRLTVSSDLAPGIHEFVLTVNGTPTNPIPLLVTGLPPAQATVSGKTPLSVPVLLCAKQEGDTQETRFPLRLKKGETLHFEVVAQRLGLTLDAELRLRNAKGEVAAFADDTFGKDPAFDYTPPEEADFSLEVRDISGVKGDRRSYALKIEAPHPDFTVRCDPNRAMIAPGNSTCLFVQIERKNGFNGEVTAKIEGLPPGVTATPAVIAPNMTLGTIFLTAETHAKVEASLAFVTASATAGSDTKPLSLVHQAQPLTEIYMPGGGRGRWETETLAVSVTEPNDFTVTLDQTKVSLKPGSEVKIAVTLHRRDDFKKAVPLDVRLLHLELFYNPLPPGVTISETTIPEGQDHGTITLRAENNAPPVKDLALPVMGFASINFVMKTWFVTPVTLTVEKKQP